MKFVLLKPFPLPILIPLGTNIRLRILFSNTPNVRNYVSQRCNIHSLCVVIKTINTISRFATVSSTIYKHNFKPNLLWNISVRLSTEDLFAYLNFNPTYFLVEWGSRLWVLSSQKPSNRENMVKSLWKIFRELFPGLRYFNGPVNMKVISKAKYR